ncbi:class I SAM-dependent methyltransferase [Undibacterium sp. SXout7W]|uniref:class I SAM-dependent methyltransferase n=1 Tax=Undibacterium sp. SXout7W TaxID=3413049 RepID=UPI003BF3B0DC
MKRILLAVAIMTGCHQLALADTALDTIIAGSHRSAANQQRDIYRHPAQTLEFFGLRPDMHVVELSPGGGWYTEILAPYLRDQGKLTAAANDPASGSEYARRSITNFKKKLDAAPALYDKVGLGIFEPPAKIDYAANHSVDLVLTFRNIHNWISFGDDTVKFIFQQAYNSLKPGGVFGVVEHRLPESRSQDAKASSGYVHESYVINMATSVGFTLAAKSDMNANPKDTADHDNGVWALPPTFANKEQGKANYEAIGESDRMTLKFIKR